MRYPDFLKTAVQLFGASATALAVVAVVGATNKDDQTTIYVAAIWWCLAALVGLWLGRRHETTNAIADMLVDARNQNMLPEQNPGAIVFNRLWLLGLVTIVSCAVAFLVPQVAAIASGFAILAGLAWRRQAAAVEAIEGRDGVRYYVEPTGPFKPTKLVRTPGFRRAEPS